MGLLFVWSLVRAMAPDVAEWTLLMRYLAYAVLLAVLYRTCDISREGTSVPFAPFSGLSAAACTASPYLLLWGIPLLWIICGVAWFRIGYGVAACWGLTGEELSRKLGRQNIALSKVILAATAAILPCIAANALFNS